MIVRVSPAEGLGSWLSKALRKTTHILNPIRLTEQVTKQTFHWTGSRWKPLRGSLLVSYAGGFAAKAKAQQKEYEARADREADAQVAVSDAAAFADYKKIAAAKLKQESAASAPAGKSTAGSVPVWVYYGAGAVLLGGGLLLFSRGKKRQRGL